jgi:signal transduction histidine kinase
METARASGQIQRRECALPGGRMHEHVYTPFRDSNGQEKILMLLRDITDSRTSRASVIRSEQLAALGELAAGVAHEINNPMNGIINYAQMLINRERDPAEVRAIAGRVVAEGDRIARIVESLLAFARRESQDFVPTRVDELLEDSLTLIGAQIRKDAIDLEVEIPPGLPRIVCAPQGVQQVFLNILSNARYALNERYPGSDENKQLRITAAAGGDSGAAKNVVVTFEDHGVGIPRANIAKVTYPFFSTKPKGKGTGLGLSICQEILRECGGRLAIESVEGKFTKVMVSLPLLAA